MENREYLNSLFDIYKDLLTEYQRTTFINYYIEDLTLSEIGENNGISKSSVGKTAKLVTDKLIDYENKLKIYANKNKLAMLMDSNNLNEIKATIEDIINS